MATKKFADLITEAEEAVLADITLAKSNLEAAQENVEACEIAAEVAETDVYEIEGSFKRLSEEFTALDHATALSEVERSKLRLTGSKLALSKAEKAQSSSDTVAADAVARVIAMALPGSQVITTFAAGFNGKPRAAELPIAVVSQAEPTRFSTEGYVSADVITVRFHRSALHRPLSTKVIREATQEMGAALEVMGNVTTSPDDMLDTARLRVMAVQPEVPIIARIDDFHHSRLGKLFAAGLADEVRYAGNLVRGTRTGGFESSHLFAYPYRSKVLSESFDNDRVRTLVIETSVIVEQRIAPTGRSLQDVAVRLVEDLSGSVFVPGLGHCESLELVASDSDLWIEDDHKLHTILESEARGLPGDAVETRAPVDANSLVFGGTERMFVLRATLVSQRPPIAEFAAA